MRGGYRVGMSGARKDSGTVTKISREVNPTEEISRFRVGILNPCSPDGRTSLERLENLLQL